MRRAKRRQKGAKGYGTAGSLKAALPPRQEIITLTVLILLTAAVVLITHWPALSAGALSADDTQYLTDNYLVQNPGWESAKRFLTEVLEPSTVQGYYQPLAMISLMMDCAVGGGNQNLMPFHRTSLVLHILNTSLVILFCYILFGKAWTACIVGLLFGMHPMTVEVISWVGERKTVLASFFSFCCLVSYVLYARLGSRKLYAATAAAYVLALMSKPTSTPLPVLLVLLDYWPLRQLSIKSVLQKLPLFAIGAVSAVITIISQGRTALLTMPESRSAAESFLTVCHNIVFYPYKILCPVKLSSHYPIPEPMSLAHPMVLAGLIGTFVLAVILLLSLRKTRCLLTGWMFFFIAIFPAMGVIGFTNVIASDKFAYLPSLGLMLPLVYFLGRLWNGEVLHAAARSRAVIILTVMVLAGLEFNATRRYLTRWKDTETLMKHMLAMTPQSASLNNGMGHFLFKAGKVDEAILYYRKALSINPRDSQANSNLGVALAEKGLTEEAFAYYSKAAASKSNDPAFYNNMGNALLHQGKFRQAVQQYQKALSIRPRYPSARYNLADALHKQGKLEQAAREYRRALELNPRYAECHNNLGSVLADQGKPAQAISQYRQALKIDPTLANAHYNLAITLTEIGQTDEAIEEYRKAIGIKPDYFDAHNNLAVVLSQTGKFEEAIPHFIEMLKVNPRDADTRNNFGAALASMGRNSQAIEQFRQALQIEPENSNVHYNLAVNLEQVGRVEEAVRHYRQSLRIKPNHKRARQRLQEILDKR